MRNIVKQLIIASSIIFISSITGCGSSSNSAISTSKPGELRLSKMDGMGQSAALVVEKTISSAPTATTTFDLGTIKASQDFYFLLSNSVDFPVTQVTITTNNANFVASPSTIDVVTPQNGGFVIPIIKVSVIHGIALNGVGYTDTLLAMGSNTCTLIITGTTTDSANNLIPLHYEIQLLIIAQTMDLDIYDNNAALDLLHPATYSLTGVGSNAPVYICDSPVIKNTGNVSIDVGNYNLTGLTLLEQFTLAPNESKILNYPVNNSGYKTITLKVTANNTISDYRKFKQDTDGSVSIVLRNF